MQGPGHQYQRHERLLSRFHWSALLVCLLNFLFFTLYGHYTVEGAQLLDNGDFSRGLAGWTIQGDRGRVETADGILKINHGVEHRSTTVSQCHPAGAMPDDLLLSAEAGSHGVEHGEKSWHEARIDLVGYDARNKGDYRVKTRLVRLIGDRQWHEFSGVFHKPASATKLCVEISLYAATGSFDAARLSLHRVSVRSFHGFVRGLLLFGWGLLGLWLVRALYSHYRERPQGIFLLLLVPLLLGGILMPYEARLEIEQRILPLLSRIGIHLASPELFESQGVWAFWPAQWDLSKLSHLSGFTLLGLILFSEGGRRPGSRFSALLLLAIATELMQFFVPGRTPRLSDVMVDMVGSGLGFALVSAWHLARMFHPGQAGNS